MKRSASWCGNAKSAKCQLIDLPAATFEAIQPGLSAEVTKVLGVTNALAAFQSYGSTAPAEVAKQMDAWRMRLAH